MFVPYKFVTNMYAHQAPLAQLSDLHPLGRTYVRSTRSLPRMDAPGSPWKPHGDLIYRTDRHGTRVGILPATCLRGEHSLHALGYRAIETGDGHLEVVCQACVSQTPPYPDNSWILRLTEPTPTRAELDDAPYQSLRRQLAPATR